MYLCVLHTHTHIHTYTYIHHTHTHTHTHAHTHTHTHTHKGSCCGGGAGRATSCRHCPIFGVLGRLITSSQGPVGGVAVRTERGREKERKRDKERARARARAREMSRESERARERQSDRATERQSETERGVGGGGGRRESERARERERARARESESESESDSTSNEWLCDWDGHDPGWPGSRYRILGHECPAVTVVTTVVLPDRALCFFDVEVFRCSKSFNSSRVIMLLEYLRPQYVLLRK